MSIKATFYYNSAEPNRIDKTSFLSPIQGFSYDILIKKPTSIINPIIELQGTGSTLPSYNYCYIPNLHRYYFITEVVILNNNLYQFMLSVDVLMSYKNEILNQNAFITYSETNSSNTKRIYNKRAIYANYNSKLKYESNSLFKDSDMGNGKGNYVLTFCGYSSNATPKSPSISQSYVLDSSALKSVFDKITGENFWDNVGNLFAGNPVEGIISIRAYPYDLFSLFNLNDTPNIKSIRIPYAKSLNIDSGITKKLDSATPFSVSLLISVNLWDFILDTPPYSKYCLYIPFIGFIDLPDNAFIYSKVFKDGDVGGLLRLLITYTINVETGNAVVSLKSIRNLQDDVDPIFTAECSFSREIPINNTNATERIGKYIQTGVQIGTAVAAIGVGIAGGVSSASMTASAGSDFTLSAMKQQASIPFQASQQSLSLFNDIAGINNNIPMSFGSTNDAFSGFIYSKAVLFHSKPVVLSEDIEHYGVPNFTKGQIKNYHGYTEIGAVHLENFNEATSDELNSINSVLMSGVILP